MAAERARACRLGRRRDFERRGAWIDFRGGPGTFPTVSFSDVYAGAWTAALCAARSSSSAPARRRLQDMHATATSGRDLMTGPELQANAIWTALHGNPLRAVLPTG